HKNVEEKIYGLGLLVLCAYASSIPLIISLPLSMACDDSDGEKVFVAGTGSNWTEWCSIEVVMNVNIGDEDSIAFTRLLHVSWRGSTTMCLQPWRVRWVDLILGMSQIDGMDSTNAKCCRALLVFDKWRCDDLASRPSQAAIEEKTTVIHVIPTKNANKDDIHKLIPAEVSPEIQRLLTLLQNSMESGEKIFRKIMYVVLIQVSFEVMCGVLLTHLLIKGLTDTSSAKARTAKDIQEISWERFPLSVDTVDKERENRLRKKEKKAAGGQGKNIKKKTQKPPAHFFSKQLKPKPIPPPLINRNMKRWQHGVYLMSNYSIMHWSSVSQNLNETINSCGDMIHTEKHGGSLLEGFPQIQINTLAVNDDFLIINSGNVQAGAAGAYKRANAAVVANAKNALITILKHIKEQVQSRKSKTLKGWINGD
ncbi:hypothetical protein Tco_0755263, partial [Tanacetum coccineum]